MFSVRVRVRVSVTDKVRLRDGGTASVRWRADIRVKSGGCAREKGRTPSGGRTHDIECSHRRGGCTRSGGCARGRWRRVCS